MQSKKKSDYGKLKLTAGQFYGDADKDKGKGETTPAGCTRQASGW